LKKGGQVKKKKRKDPPADARANEQPKRASSNDIDHIKQPSKPTNTYGISSKETDNNSTTKEVLPLLSLGTSSAEKQAATNSGPSPMDLDDPNEHTVEMEHVGCEALDFRQLSVHYPIGFDFSSCYPFQQHGPTSVALSKTNLATTMLWDASTLGQI